MKPKKTWREKLADDKGLPKVEPITGAMSQRWGAGTVVIPAPREVDEVMRSVPAGRLITIDLIRSRLARKHGATIGCPLTTGIFAWIAAGAAAEDEADGRRPPTPYWRTLKTGGVLNPKYPGGVEAQRSRLVAEGHRVAKKGVKFVVADFERALLA